jgi:hypothetical protein
MDRPRGAAWVGAVSTEFRGTRRGKGQTNRISTFRPHNEDKQLKRLAKGLSSKMPTLKARKQIGLRREICRNVPVANTQGCSRKWRRKFGGERTGAGEWIRTLDRKLSPALGKVHTAMPAPSPGSSRGRQRGRFVTDLHSRRSDWAWPSSVVAGVVSLKSTRK